jgi:DNA-directed RNA polymerase specialized sigma24 family protein
MATERLSMKNVREILRLKWAVGLAHREVARSVGVSVGAVGTIVGRAVKAGLLNWDAVGALDEGELGTAAI